MNNMMTKNDGSRPEMDDLLRDYFQHEMPRPWPTFKAPRQLRTVSFWARSAGRMALAACIALMISAYLALGGSFTTPETVALPKAGETMGMREKGPKAVLPSLPAEEIPLPVIGETTKHKSR